MDMTRRGLLTMAGGTLAGARQAAGEGGATVGAARTISLDHNYYHGWPTVVRRSNGELLTVWSGGRESHVCPFGRVELTRSKDSGETWSWPEVLMDTAIDDRDAGILETSKGTLLVTTFTSLAYVPVLEGAVNWAPGRLERWKAADRRVTREEQKKMLGTWMLRSVDGGMTWSAPYRVPVNSPHGPVALRDGRILYAGKRLWDRETRIGVAESKDDGVTWNWLAELPTRAGDSFENYHELHAVEAADGRILVQIRNHNAANKGETLQCESSDGGRTWTAPRTIGVWGLPSHLLRLRDGRLVMTYGYRRKPFGNQARLSVDGGRTWGAAVTISSDGMSGDLGYPSTVELADGELLTVWYELEAGSPRAQLRQARWKP
ncbi:MAG: exo-alpha-sialidase [Bryobacterales bacterium]|nr:exo-alpha-sialidase [Bryobacterales bacterium]